VRAPACVRVRVRVRVREKEKEKAQWRMKEERKAHYRTRVLNGFACVDGEARVFLY